MESFRGVGSENLCTTLFDVTYLGNRLLIIRLYSLLADCSGVTKRQWRCRTQRLRAVLNIQQISEFPFQRWSCKRRSTFTYPPRTRITEQELSPQRLTSPLLLPAHEFQPQFEVFLLCCVQALFQPSDLLSSGVAQ